MSFNIICENKLTLFAKIKFSLKFLNSLYLPALTALQSEHTEICLLDVVSEIRFSVQLHIADQTLLALQEILSLNDINFFLGLISDSTCL